jgi:GT2 family glycosyltransferase/glycosyltransferase involved in cell wall biosynthesis
VTQDPWRPREQVDQLRAWWLRHVATDVVGHGAGDERADAPSVVVCVHDATDAVRACLDSLIESRSLPYRIVIVDDASQAECAAMLDTYAETHDFISLHRLQENQGYTAAANFGLAHAQGLFLVLLNSDTEVAPGWMEALVACAVSAPEVGVVGPLSNAASWQSVPFALTPNGALAAHPMPHGSQLRQLCQRLEALSPRRYPRVELLNGFCLGIRRSVLDRIGQLDAEAFPVGFGEENDFCLRARDAGFELVVADDAYVAHRKSASFGHAKRGALSRRGDDVLRQRHGDGRVSAALEHCRTDAALEAARQTARAALAPEHPVPIPFPILQRLLFVLPARAGGGGVHSVVQEVQAMRELGFDARIAVPESFAPSYFDAYPDVTGLDLWLEPFSGAASLRALADGVAVIVATVFTSVAIIDESIPADCGALFAYYIQDYEPRFYEPGTPGHEQADASYAWERCALRFAKTDWICAEVEARHGVSVAKVRPSLERDLYRPAATLPAAASPVLIAMLRPSTARRAPQRTLRVLARVRALWPGEVRIRLFGCGWDELTPELASLAAGMELLGPLRRDQVAEVMRSAHVFVDLSDYQAFGRTGLEAMACGCVPLLPALGGCSEFARHDHNAVIVDTGSDSACVKAVLELLGDPERRLRLRAAGLATAAGFDRVDAAISELRVIAAALQEKRSRTPSGAGSPAHRLPCLSLDDAWTPRARPGGLPAGIMTDAAALEETAAERRALLSLHDLLARQDIDLLRQRIGARSRTLVLYYGADRADLDKLDAALCVPTSAQLVALLREARCVLVTADVVAERLRRIGARIAWLTDLLDDDGWDGRSRPGAATGPLRVLWVDDDDSDPSCAAPVALELARSQFGAQIVVDRVSLSPAAAERNAVSATTHPVFATARALSDWCGTQPPWHAAFARVSRGAAAAGRGRLWQRRFASMGVCALVERDEFSLGLASGSDAILVDPGVPAWLELIRNLQARSADLIRVGDNARRLLTVSEADPSAASRTLDAISLLLNP